MSFFFPVPAVGGARREAATTSSPHCCLLQEAQNGKSAANATLGDSPGALGGIGPPQLDSPGFGNRNDGTQMNVDTSRRAQ